MDLLAQEIAGLKRKAIERTDDGSGSSHPPAKRYLRKGDLERQKDVEVAKKEKEEQEAREAARRERERRDPRIKVSRQRTTNALVVASLPMLMSAPSPFARSPSHSFPLSSSLAPLNLVSPRLPAQVSVARPLAQRFRLAHLPRPVCASLSKRLPSPGPV